METTTLKNIGQERASFAYGCAKEGTDKYPKLYKSYVRKIPALIKTNGLSATFAFIKAKGGKGKDKKQSTKNTPSTKENAYDLIYQHVQNWLVKSPVNQLLGIKDNETAGEGEQQELVEQLINLNSDKYRLATLEVLEFLVWLARFAEGLDKSDDKSEDDANVK